MGLSYSSMKKETVFMPAVEKTLKASLKGHLFVVTGCTSGTGYWTALKVAQRGGRVLMLNRTSERAKSAENSIREASPDCDIQTVECDLMDFESVRTAAAKVKDLATDGLDCLVLNAGIMGFPDEPSKQGYDVQMQTNHLSHFLLVKELMPYLTKAAESKGDARIVSMTSLAFKGGPLEAQYFGKNGGNLGGNGVGYFFDGPRWLRYHQSKLANAVFTYALKDRLDERQSKVKSLLAHPGLASTNLQVQTDTTGGMPTWFSYLFQMKAMSSEDGAAPLIKCVIGENKDIASGDFYGPAGLGMRGPPQKVDPLPAIVIDEKNKNLLWTESVKAVGDIEI